MQWMKEANPREDFILILDPDVLIRRPILPAHYGVVPGRPAAFNAWCGHDCIFQSPMPITPRNLPRGFGFSGCPVALLLCAGPHQRIIDALHQKQNQARPSIAPRHLLTLICTTQVSAVCVRPSARFCLVIISISFT